ncbi:hypothetical protein D6D03_06022 [Aureobasidium pullulans]|nr:hypothetical protein D6D03_06022 [Aureobasidium pullulans]
MGCLSAIFVRSDDSRDCHDIHGRKYLGNTDRNLVGTQAHTMLSRIHYQNLHAEVRQKDLCHVRQNCRRWPLSARHDFSRRMNFCNWGGMDSSPLSHSAPLTANTWNGQDWQQLTRLGAGILAIHAV